MTTRFRLDVAYDGTAYGGWQVQPNTVTIQGKLESVFNQLTGEIVKVHGSGRTDQGVHARRQVAHVDVEKVFPSAKLSVSLNALLPPDIRVVRVARAKPDFHARRQAVSKEYRYFIWNGQVLPPTLRLYRTHIRRKLDIPAMQEAAALLVGRHDFAAYTANSDQELATTVRNLTDLSVRKDGDEVRITARGEGFLYKMVRSLSGMLIQVGKGVEEPAAAAEVLATCERTARVPSAPSRGLFLWRVWY